MIRFQPPARTSKKKRCDAGLCRTEAPERALRPVETLEQRQGRLRRPSPVALQSRAATTAGLRRRGGGRAVSTIAKPPLEVVALNRLGFGPRPGELAEFRALGTTDEQRLRRWVDQQLAPASIDDSLSDRKESEANYATLGKSFDRVWQEHVLPEPDWEVYIRPFYETELRTLLRATYSRRQLFEQTVRFWHDHFNVHGEEAGPLFMTYDRDVIRRHAFGNFRVLLGDVVRHPVMLEYLDNKYNSYEPYLENDGLNENFSRELLELHTLGAEHYYRNADPQSVPLDGQGRPLGYTDADVTAAARCLTGWTVRDQPWFEEIGNEGGFVYHHPWHDNVNDKVVLGQAITDKETPMRDGDDLLDVLAAHPGTARFVARKLCRRFVADQPSQALVDAAATTFRQNLDAPDQIARVLRTIVLSEEFRETFGEKVKRPLEIFVSAVRAGRASFSYRYGEDLSAGLVWSLYLTGHLPFAWHPPNGYPDVRQAWTTSAPRVVSWNLTNWLPFSYREEWWSDAYFDVAAETPASVRTARQVVDFWSQRLYGRKPPGAERALLMDYMAQGSDRDQPLDWSQPWLAPDRLRSTVGLMMLSPTFLLL